MKNSEQMAQDVLLRIETQKREKKRKCRMFQRVAASAVCICILSVLLVSVQQWGVTSIPAEPSVDTTLPKEPTMSAPAETSTEGVDIDENKETTESGCQSYLTLDINPSLQFVVEDGKVVSCLAINDEGAEILADIALEGLTVEQALPVVLNKLIELGYIAGADGSAPVLLLAAYDSSGTVELLDTAAAVVSDTLAEQNIFSRVIMQQITDLEYVELLAEQYHVSAGKMQYVLNLIRRERALSLEEASDRTIVELFSMDIEQRLIEPEYKIGEYDQYGEKVLYGPGIEVPYKGWVWEDFSTEYQDSLLEIYSPEDLAMLARDRIWTTMPNVVGLTDTEACALLRSREIVPRVIYENSLDAREKGFVDGQCFEQDVEQGMRWNSDASIFIWVLTSEGEPGYIYEATYAYRMELETYKSAGD